MFVTQVLETSRTMVLHVRKIPFLRKEKNLFTSEGFIQILWFDGLYNSQREDYTVGAGTHRLSLIMQTLRLLFLLLHVLEQLPFEGSVYFFESPQTSMMAG